MAASVAVREPSSSLDLVVGPGRLPAGIPTPGWKRTIDIIGAAVGMVVLFPVFLALSAAIMVDSRGGPIFRQTRVGLGGRCFTCWKFRSMRVGAEALQAQLSSGNDASGPIFKMRNDPRRTRVGRLLRRTSLDELPQLINVLRGDMSLVGPRPPMVAEVLEYDDDHLQRLLVTPGMTGLWQVTLRRDHQFSDMVRLDVEYARRRTFWLDVSILVRTIPTVIFGHGSY